jgi:hypothetical protein
LNTQTPSVRVEQHGSSILNYLLYVAGLCSGGGSDIGVSFEAISLVVPYAVPVLSRPIAKRNFHSEISFGNRSMCRVELVDGPGVPGRVGRDGR